MNTPPTIRDALPLVYGWLVGALGGGTFVIVGFWIEDTLARESSTFRIGEVFHSILWLSFWVGVVMSPAVLLAAAIYFLAPNFRGWRSLLVAFGVGLITVFVLILFVDEMLGATDLGTRVTLSVGALFVAGVFWWVTLKTERVDDGAT